MSLFLFEYRVKEETKRQMTTCLQKEDDFFHQARKKCTINNRLNE